MSVQDALLSRLAHGPATVADLVRAAGYAGAGGCATVSKELTRLRRMGYPVQSVGKPGSHRGSLYFLTAKIVASGSRCWRCGGFIARDHAGAVVCSPCERSLLDAELAAVTA